MNGLAPIRLWEGDAPGARGSEEEDVPTVTPYVPGGGGGGAAIVVCPGGGYAGRACHEGDHYARWLNAHGMAAFVLKYRVGSRGYRHPCMLLDGQRAVRLVRARAPEWGIVPGRIGIMGSSAGGHLAAMVLTRFDGGDAASADPVAHQSCRPDLGILCYPVIAMTGPFCHTGSRQNLAGGDPSAELLDEISPKRHVCAQTPPVFLWHTLEDRSVPMENSLLFAQALREAGVPFDLHVYEKGGHGLGLGSGQYDPSKWLPWTRDCLYWLKTHGFGAGWTGQG